ncbi:DUF3304 domain-containing protein [Glaciimonas immobilis]|nr:DUF3304 domain-containing protein [Glaciimonas immobilis]
MACANHTDGYIHSYGVQEPLTMAKSIIYALNCQPHEMGNGLVAAGFTLPDQWRPGMKVKVRWNRPIRGEDNWIEKITAIRWYDTPETLFVHFFANDEVRVLSAFAFPGPHHPIPMNLKIAPPEEE